MTILMLQLKRANYTQSFAFSPLQLEQDPVPLTVRFQNAIKTFEESLDSWPFPSLLDIEVSQGDFRVVHSSVYPKNPLQDVVRAYQDLQTKVQNARLPQAN